VSIEAVAWALGQAPVENAQEHVLLIALADCSNGYGKAAWPSVRWLARRGRCSVRTVQRHLKALEKRGLIRRGDARMVAHLPADRRPTVWDLALELRLSEPVPPPDSDGDFESQERGVNLSPATDGAERGDSSCAERGDNLSRGDTVVTPRGVTELCHPNRHVEPFSSGGYVTGEPHLADTVDNPPPKFHPGHEGRIIPECDECTALVIAREAWLRALIATTEPKRFCAEHPSGTERPCRNCEAARKGHQRWQLDRERADKELRANLAAAQSAEAHAASEARRMAIAACSLCDEDGHIGDSQIGISLCDHRPPSRRPSLREQFEALRSANATSEESLSA